MKKLSEVFKNPNAVKIWLVIYAVGLILIPPVKYGTKYVFFAEILLLPILLVFILRLFEGKISRPPKALVFVWLALIVAFFSGSSRGDLVDQISIYKDNLGETFSLARDFTRSFRYFLIFTTPWLILEVFKEGVAKNAEKFAEFFLECLIISGVFSCVLNFLDLFKVIDLANLGYFQRSLYWDQAGRSYGTLASPLDSSLVYGFLFLATFILGPQVFKKYKTVFFGSLFLFFIALLSTRGGTALLSLLGGGLFYIIQKKRRAKQAAICTLAFFVFSFAVLFMIYLHPQWAFLYSKASNLFFRSETWIRWAKQIPIHPHILLTGINFSALTVDNSIMTILIGGGILLLGAFSFWFYTLAGKVPKASLPLLIFWLWSWLALDSVSYWGMGRIFWILLGIWSLRREPNVTA